MPNIMLCGECNRAARPGKFLCDICEREDSSSRQDAVKPSGIEREPPIRVAPDHASFALVRIRENKKTPHPVKDAGLMDGPTG